MLSILHGNINTRGFPIFLGVMKREHWPIMRKALCAQSQYKEITISFFFNTYFISNQGKVPAFKIACIFKIFRAQSCLTETNFKCIPVIFRHSSLTYSIRQNQSSFYEIRSLAIYINIKRVNRKRLNFKRTFWNIWNFILLVTEDDLALKIVQQISF